ncbi:MAG: hypothetical protein IJR47_01390 [Clostridia bacterium]|nr:hypothetical protein [Clostridia bacterium]
MDNSINLKDFVGKSVVIKTLVKGNFPGYDNGVYKGTAKMFKTADENAADGRKSENSIGIVVNESNGVGIEFYQSEIESIEAE